MTVAFFIAPGLTGGSFITVAGLVFALPMNQTRHEAFSDAMMVIIMTIIR